MSRRNVEMIRAEGVRLIHNRIPFGIRQELNAGVKAGELGHLPKKGRLDEVYFHPAQREEADNMRRQLALHRLKVTAGILVDEAQP